MLRVKTCRTLVLADGDDADIIVFFFGGFIEELFIPSLLRSSVSG